MGRVPKFWVKIQSSSLDIYIFIRLMKSHDFYFVRLKKIVKLIYGIIRTVRLIFVRLKKSLDLFIGK